MMAATKFLILIAMIQILFQAETCANPKGGEPTDCNPVADIVFMLDVHSSILPSEFEMQKRFVRQLLGHHNTLPGAVQVGYVICGNGNATVIDFEPLDSDVTQSYNNISYPTSRANFSGTSDCLDSVKLVFSRGRRKVNSQIAIFMISDNESWNNKDTKLIKDIGITILVIGVGRINFQKLHSLRNMASDDRKSFVLSSFEDLERLSTRFSTGSCLTRSLNLAVPVEPTTSSNKPTTLTPDSMCKTINDVFYQFVPFLGWVKINCDPGMRFDTKRCECISS